MYAVSDCMAVVSPHCLTLPSLLSECAWRGLCRPRPPQHLGTVGVPGGNTHRVMKTDACC